MKSKNFISILFILSLIFFAINCEKQFSPTDVNNNKNNKENSETQSDTLILNKTESSWISINEIYPNNNQVFNTHYSNKTINWHTSVEFLNIQSPYFTMPWERRVRVWIDGEKIFDTGKQLLPNNYSKNGSITLGPGSHKIKVTVWRRDAYYDGIDEWFVESQKTNSHNFQIKLIKPSTPTLQGLVYQSYPKLKWNAVSGAVKYKIYKNGSYYKTKTSTSYIDWSEFPVERSYTLTFPQYFIKAVDGYGQESSPSKLVIYKIVN